jgi:sporulation protein YlmC with PRC-barrel domain
MSVRKLSSLLERPVVDESGRKLGRVHDVRVDSDCQVEALVIGSRGLLVRLGATRDSLPGRDAVAWADVVEVTDDRIVVRDARS